MATTNYYHTLIEVAEDCPATAGEAPPVRGGKKSVAALQFELLVDRPYELTSDDVLFAVFAARQEVAEADLAEERARFFARGQPCFRASPKTARFGRTSPSMPRRWLEWGGSRWMSSASSKPSLHVRPAA